MECILQTIMSWTTTKLHRLAIVELQSLCQISEIITRCMNPSARILHEKRRFCLKNFSQLILEGFTIYDATYMYIN